MAEPKPAPPQDVNDLAVMLAKLKINWPDIYRHIIGMIKAVQSGK